MAEHTFGHDMRIVARIRPLLTLLLCFGSMLSALPASAVSPDCSVQQDAPPAPAPEMQDGEAPSIGEGGAESAPDVDARRRLCELNLGPASVTLGKLFELELLRLRKEDRRRCRPPDR